MSDTTAHADVAPDAGQDRLDGPTVDLGEWWFNLRPLNTEPLCPSTSKLLRWPTWTRTSPR